MYHDSLKELIQCVKSRVEQATRRIDQSDDPAILDREMRFIRPFWECFTARQRLNQSRYWESLQVRIATPTAPAELYVKTPLVWYPRRRPLWTALQNESLQNRAPIYNLLRGLEIVLFNFTTLLGRAQHVLGLDDPDSFEIQTRESDGGSYYAARRILKRTDPAGNEYRIVTCRFRLPNADECKIEKDYSDNRSNPVVILRLTSATSARGGDERQITFEGTQAQLNRHDGKLSLQRL